jgi:hypothetical protein
MNTTAHERFAEAAQLFRENEAMFGDVKQDKEKANLYRGLAALAEGLAQLEEPHETTSRFTPGQHPASVRPR